MAWMVWSQVSFHQTCQNLRKQRLVLIQVRKCRIIKIFNGNNFLFRNLKRMTNPKFKFYSVERKIRKNKTSLQRTKQLGLISKSLVVLTFLIIKNIDMQKFKQKTTDNTFKEFVQAGMNINPMIGVDFSASMLPASHFDSPHFVGNGSILYEKALIHLSSLMLYQTNKRKASVYAIGAKIKHPKSYTGEKIQQYFPFNADFQNEQIQGIQKIRQQYRTVLNYITFSGPTDITIIIKKAIQKSVLVILSDGKITNTKQVQEILKQCATLFIYVAFFSYWQQ